MSHVWLLCKLVSPLPKKINFRYNSANNAYIGLYTHTFRVKDHENKVYKVCLKPIFDPRLL